MNYRIFKKLLATYISLLILSVGFLSCSDFTKEQADQKENAVEEPKNDASDVLELSSAQMQAVGILTGPIEERNLSAVVKANGELAVPPQNRAMVSILSGGLIRRINIFEGQQVKKGQVLAMIENQDLIKIQQDYLAAKSNFTFINAEYQRQMQLQAAGAGTGKSLQSAEASYNAEKSRIQAYESQIRQLGIPVGKVSEGQILSQFPLVSPISGTVGTINATTGSFVQPGTAVMEVVDNSKIHCDLIVFEKDLYKVKTGQKVILQLTNQENQQVEGRISGINKSFENESKGVIVHAIINNSNERNLIPGMYVTALINVGNEEMPVVPVDAIISQEGREYIFTMVKSTDKKNNQQNQMMYFKKTEVTTGISELGFIHIKPLNKLPVNVQIVIKGAFYLQSKAAGSMEED